MTDKPSQSTYTVAFTDPDLWGLLSFAPQEMGYLLEVISAGLTGKKVPPKEMKAIEDFLLPEIKRQGNPANIALARLLRELKTAQERLARNNQLYDTIQASQQAERQSYIQQAKTQQQIIARDIQRVVMIRNLQSHQ
jgi:hypothetical protein